jgi:AcrR family transcriptional regulator
VSALPPRIKTSNEDIIKESIAIVREQGIEFVTARSVAAKLNCSIQPIFRTFGTIEDLKAATYKRAEEIYNTAMMEAMKNSREGFLALGLAYVNFAKSESNIFRLLFMSNVFNQGSAANIVGSTAGDDEVIALICEATGLDVSKSQELHTSLWFTAHGIASLLVTNSCTLTDDETRQVLKNVFNGLLHALRTEVE